MIYEDVISVLECETRFTRSIYSIAPDSSRTYEIDTFTKFCLADPRIAAEVGQILDELDLQILENRWKERRMVAVNYGREPPEGRLDLRLYRCESERPSLTLWEDCRRYWRLDGASYV